MEKDLNKLHLINGIIDSHFHLFQMKNVGMDYIEIIEACFDNGLKYALDIGITPGNFKERMDTASKYKGLYTAHGLYPSQCTAETLDSDIEYLEKCLIEDPKAIALGEIGLDFFRNYGTEELQTALLKKQLSLADRLDLPVIIHSRDAEELTIKILSESAPERKGIIHCFSYSPETAAKFIDMGFYISFAGNVTYKNAELLQSAAAVIPLDRLLLETDAPYLSPQKVRSKKNHPGYIGYTYDFVAELRGIKSEELIEAVKNNFLHLFRISSEG